MLTTEPALCDVLKTTESTAKRICVELAQTEEQKGNNTQRAEKQKLKIKNPMEKVLSGSETYFGAKRRQNMTRGVFRCLEMHSSNF